MRQPLTEPCCPDSKEDWWNSTVEADPFANTSCANDPGKSRQSGKRVSFAPQLEQSQAQAWLGYSGQCPEYLEQFGLDATNDKSWSSQHQARVRENRQPLLEIALVGPEELGKQIRYVFQCAFWRPSVDIARAEWRCTRQLVEIRLGLHDVVKQSIGAATYARHFGTTPFASSWRSGTEIRLRSWCQTLVRYINSAAAPPVVAAKTLKFLDAPALDHTVLALAKAVALEDSSKSDAVEADVQTPSKVGWKSSQGSKRMPYSPVSPTLSIDKRPREETKLEASPKSVKKTSAAGLRERVRIFTKEMIYGKSFAVVLPSGKPVNVQLYLNRALDTLTIQASNRTQRVTLAYVEEVFVGERTAKSVTSEDLETPLDECCVTFVLKEDHKCITFKVLDPDDRSIFAMCMETFIQAAAGESSKDKEKTPKARVQTLKRDKREGIEENGSVDKKNASQEEGGDDVLTSATIFQRTSQIPSQVEHADTTSHGSKVVFYDMAEGDETSDEELQEREPNAMIPGSINEDDVVVKDLTVDEETTQTTAASKMAETELRDEPSTCTETNSDTSDKVKMEIEAAKKAMYEMAQREAAGTAKQMVEKAEADKQMAVEMARKAALEEVERIEVQQKLALEEAQMRRDEDRRRADVEKEAAMEEVRREIFLEMERKEAQKALAIQEEMEHTQKQKIDDLMKQAQAEKALAIEQAEKERLEALKLADTILEEARKKARAEQERAEIEKAIAVERAVEEARMEALKKAEQTQAEKDMVLEQARKAAAELIEKTQAEQVLMLEQARKEASEELERARHEKALAVERAVEQVRKDTMAQVERAEAEKDIALEQAKMDLAADMQRVEDEKAKAIEQARREMLEEVSLGAAQKAADLAKNRRQALRSLTSTNNVTSEIKLTAEFMDAVLAKAEAALRKAEEMAIKGSHVRRRQAELELLSQFEVARDFMTSLLCRDVTGRGLLQEVFGGDCCRISFLRAILDTVTFSSASAEDQRMPMCVRACESIERVLEDLGFGEALTQALIVEREARSRHAQLLEQDLR